MDFLWRVRRGCRANGSFKEAHCAHEDTGRPHGGEAVDARKRALPYENSRIRNCLRQKRRKIGTPTPLADARRGRLPLGGRRVHDESWDHLAVALRLPGLRHQNRAESATGPIWPHSSRKRGIGRTRRSVLRSAAVSPKRRFFTRWLQQPGPGELNIFSSLPIVVTG
jgi:hypothetical protein